MCFLPVCVCMWVCVCACVCVTHSCSSLFFFFFFPFCPHIHMAYDSLSSRFLSYLFAVFSSSPLSSLSSRPQRAPGVSVAVWCVAPDTRETKRQAPSILTASLPNIKLITSPLPPPSLCYRCELTADNICGNISTICFVLLINEVQDEFLVRFRL